MSNFESITLSFDMRGSLYYSSKFRDILIGELGKFAGEVAAVAKSKYGESPLSHLFCNFCAFRNVLEGYYKNLKKMKNLLIQTIIKLLK